MFTDTDITKAARIVRLMSHVKKAEAPRPIYDAMMRGEFPNAGYQFTVPGGPRSFGEAARKTVSGFGNLAGEAMRLGFTGGNGPNEHGIFRNIGGRAVDTVLGNPLTAPLRMRGLLDTKNVSEPWRRHKEDFTRAFDEAGSLGGYVGGRFGSAVQSTKNFFAKPVYNYGKPMAATPNAVPWVPNKTMGRPDVNRMLYPTPNASWYQPKPPENFRQALGQSWQGAKNTVGGLARGVFTGNGPDGHGVIRNLYSAATGTMRPPGGRAFNLASATTPLHGISGPIAQMGTARNYVQQNWIRPAVRNLKALSQPTTDF